MSDSRLAARVSDAFSGNPRGRVWPISALLGFLVLSLSLGFPGRTEEPVADAGTNVSGLRLKNGDFLPGGQWRIESDGFLLHPPWSLDSVRVPFSEVAYWMRVDPNMAGRAFDMIVETWGGEQVTCRGARMENGILRLDVSGSRPWTVAWQEVKRVRLLPESRRIFHGPYSGQGWSSRRKKTENADTLNPFAGKLHGRPARRMRQSPGFQLSDHFLMEIELLVSHRNMNHRVYLYTFENNRRTRANMTLMFTRKQMKVHWSERQSSNKWTRKSWSKEIEHDLKVQRLRIHGDVLDGKMTFQYNGKEINAFAFPLLKSMGDSMEIRLAMQSLLSSEPVVLNAATVLKWDGGDPPPAGPPEDMDRVARYDGKSLSGDVIEITADHVVVSDPVDGSLARLERGEVYEITRPAPADDVGGLPEAAASSLFTGYPGDLIFLRMTGMEDGSLLGSSPVWGDEVRIPLSSLEFWRLNHAEEEQP